MVARSRWPSSKLPPGSMTATASFVKTTRLTDIDRLQQALRYSRGLGEHPAPKHWPRPRAVVRLKSDNDKPLASGHFGRQPIVALNKGDGSDSVHGLRTHAH